jgi:YidC/Oxa1 family membrane protein insertase
MERRAIIAVVLSVLILVLYQEFVIKRIYPHPENSAEENAPPPPAATEPETAAPAAHPAAPVGEQEKAAPALVQGRDITVETDLYRAVFTTGGGRLKSLQLKRYRASVGPDSPPLELILEPGSQLPLGLELRGKKDLPDAGVLYRADTDHITVSGDQSATLTLSGELAGTPVTKRLTFQGNRYLFDLDVDAPSPPAEFSEMALTWREGYDPSITGKEVIFDTVLALQANKLQHEAFKGLGSGKLLEKNIAWVGFSGRYFFAALVPNAGDQNDLRVWMKQQGKSIETQLLFPPHQFSAKLNLYLGPKDISVLERVGHSLRRAVDLGWFTFVALPLLQVLRLSHKVTGNYGIDVLLLTVVIKILFIPLTQKSLRSMREMQKLQPQMQKIRERLKDKPDEMNKEIMELYRRHKVNPLGGCLPMILQLPVFVGLYQALLNAVELRHAPFFGWITDLSAPDRLGTMQLPFVHPAGIPVMTLLMGVSMFGQQWMTPSTGDPTQQRAMLIMPVVFTFMFINFPAGLTLYWLVNNILTIAQQLTINRSKS